MLELKDIVRCPRCLSPLRSLTGQNILCSNAQCIYATQSFPTAAGQPVLIDFEQSIFERNAYEGGRGSVLPRDDSVKGPLSRARRALLGKNNVALKIATQLLDALSQRNGRAQVLVIGGGAMGSGAKELYASEKIDVVGTDVYASPFTRLVADGHCLPFTDECFDAVWIQAVLEHVLDPAAVVAEIFRVLRSDGLVFADTPFMQQVHEEAYDFTRFTLSGHRWLFRRFEQIDAGATGGAGTAALWSMRYLLRALGFGNKGASVLSLPLLWLRFFDGITRHRPNLDAASGIYFFGRKSVKTLHPRDLVAYYEWQRSG